MKKLSVSFLIALTLHIALIAVSGVVIGDKKKSFFEFQSVIPVNFGTGKSEAVTSKKNPTAKESVRARSGLKIDPTTETTTSSSESSSSQAGTKGGGDNGTAGSFESSIISYKGPAYPRVAQVRGLEGSVKIKVIVSAEGFPLETMILKSSGHEVLDLAVKKVVPEWRFQKNSADYFVLKTVVFELKN